jgi:hypothetical protein
VQGVPQAGSSVAARKVRAKCFAFVHHRAILSVHGNEKPRQPTNKLMLTVLQYGDVVAENRGGCTAWDQSSDCGSSRRVLLDCILLGEPAWQIVRPTGRISPSF